ncbi:MAG: PIN domain-containing protein [Acidobacteria bacterium]|nr:PIN domain-containing protein [Acidobacteriota bacterium]
MACSVDTNILVALWKGEEDTAEKAHRALSAAASQGSIVLCGAVFAELLAYPKRSSSFIREFCDDTGILIDWTVSEKIWLAAGTAFQAYTVRRNKQGAGSPRRILADFLIGAHAAENGHSLLTMDDRIFAAAFPTLKVIKS